MQTNKEVIRSVLIPLTEDALLLPHSALIEIIPERDIRQLDGSPEWVVGEIEWNNETMPLLSIETATGSEKHQQSKRSRLIVLAFLTKNNRYNYLAIRATGVPKLVQLVPDALEAKESHGIGSKFVNFYGTLNNQSVILPNMAELEANILSINVDNSHLSLAKA
jgi:chemosensory pili system protein ChpC